MTSLGSIGCFYYWRNSWQKNHVNPHHQKQFISITWRFWRRMAALTSMCRMPSEGIYERWDSRVMFTFVERFRVWLQDMQLVIWSYESELLLEWDLQPRMTKCPREKISGKQSKVRCLTCNVSFSQIKHNF
jgi:hypothetical protein